MAGEHDVPKISHAKAGFSMRPHAGGWCELTVYITNPGEARDVEVAVSGKSPRIGAEKVICRRPVHLFPKSKRQEKFYVPFGKFAHFEVQLYHKEIRICRDSFPLRPVDQEAPVFLVVDETYCSYSFLSKLKLPHLELAPAALKCRPRELPEKWTGYDGVDIVVLGTFCQENLNGKQVEALKQWVFGGGMLIISSGGRYEQYRNSFIEEITDIRMLGVRGVMNLPSLTKRYGAQVKIDKHMYLTEVNPGGSQVILWEDQLPLIIVSSFGAGKVIFLSFDPSHESLKSWGGANALWAELFGLRGGLFPEERTNLPDSVEPVLMDIVGVSVPEFRPVAIFLLTYLGVVIFSYIFFRFRKKPELAWLVYPVAIPVAVWIAYQMGQVGKGESGFSVSEISLTELSPGNGVGKSRGYLGFFSPGGLTASITFNDPTVYGPRVSKAIPERAPFKVVETRQDNLFALENLNLSAGTLQTLNFNNIVHLGEGIDINMVLTGEGVEGEIVNRTGRRIEGCLLVYNRHIKPLGAVKNGDVLKVRMADPNCSSWRMDYSSSAIKTRENVVRDKIISSLFKMPILAKPLKAGFCFFGWIPGRAFEFSTVGMTEKKDALALVMMKIPLDAKKGDNIFIPKGICDVQQVGQQSLLIRGEWWRSQREGYGKFDLIVPNACRNIAAREMKIYFQYDAVDMEVTLELFNWETEQWKKLDISREIPITDARAYLDKGMVRVKVEAKQTREVDSDSLFPGYWEIRDLDIEIRGSLAHM